MIFMALCDDEPHSSGTRAALLPTHSAHVLEVLDRLALAAPFGPVDGLEMTETAGLTGSIFGIDAADAAEATALMRADPYSGPAWRNVGILAASDMHGQWVRHDHGGEGGIMTKDRVHLLLSDTDESAPPDVDILLSARLRHIGMAVGETPSGYRSLTIIRAATIAAARDRGRAIYGPAARLDAMFVPVGLGRWVGMPDLTG